MRTFSVMIHQDSLLSECINNHPELFQANAVLIQLFSLSREMNHAVEVAIELENLLPEAVIIGSTAAEAYFDEASVTEGILLSFTLFEHTRIESFVMDGFEKDLNKHITEKDGIVLLFNSDVIDEEALLRGAPTLVIGGKAFGDDQSFVLSGSRILTNGIVGVHLTGQKLDVTPYYETFWKSASRSYKVTKSFGQRLFEIEGMNAHSFFEKYLGEKAANRLPNHVSHAPLLHVVNGQLKPFSVIESFRDGSVKVDSFLPKGTLINFSYFDAITFQSFLKRINRQAGLFSLEGLFSYSSVPVKDLFSNGMSLNASHLSSSITSVCLASEYFSDGTTCQHSNNSTIMAMLSETDAEHEKVQPQPLHNQEMKDLDGLMALSHLIKASTEELETLNVSLQQSEQRFKSLFEQNPNLVYSVDNYGKITSVNPALKSLLGYTSEEVMSKHSLQFVASEDAHMTRDKFYQTFQGVAQTYDAHLVDKSGAKVLFTITNIPIIVNGEIIGAYGIGKSNMNQLQAEEKIAHLAYYDVLTELPNRLLFENLLNESLNNTDDKLAVMFIDLDRFKLINDSLGHQQGDHILKQVTNRIKEAIQDDAILARFGGDEFTVLLPGLKDEKEALMLAKRVMDQLKAPIVYQNVEYFMTVGIGISIFPHDGLDLDTLMRNSYIALDRAKQQGASYIEFYTDEMTDKAFERLELESYLRRAIEKDELTLYYQPQVNLDEQKIYACEALIRWNHPKLGLVSPAEFIPLAEETGLIEEIGIWVLNEACIQTRKWQELGYNDLSISVNVSGRQFQSANFVETVRRALTTSGLSAESLHLEVTESTTLVNTDYSISMLNELRGMGIKVSIDDFGTGYSSLSYLKDFPLDILKIDQSFIRNLQENNADAAIVKAVITMCEGLNLSIVAEGIETKEQGEIIRSFGCNFAQGFFYSKPLNRDRFEKLLLSKQFPLAT
ncbi:EAL domain-containing protein [Guptibacillus hwajinpoensis]|uniref:Diguanylate cyclase (GGDEF)-like protein/PAS domain S-box-containing protein n=1 Tax=Guptibacillus hwajinpoensis TaxID=208199 RepID=A0ABU0K296_9BACL|nr:EAL domain-containing protein [Alkalihalobacillus hemicentroti]MDQ0483482.1 diguanylate cyclase (GGDEF)-like protein/PAS domain S-box-containing protein [Alkalihalobacillus hemicentroti]